MIFAKRPAAGAGRNNTNVPLINHRIRDFIDLRKNFNFFCSYFHLFEKNDIM